MLRRLTSVPRAIFIAALIASTACTAGRQPPAAGGSSGTPSVSQLRDIQQLRDRFNQDRGDVRLILLTSPT